jgi:hypothetical protein
MKTTGWLAAALVAGGLVYGARGGCLNTSHSAPDEKLAKHFEETCEIARDNVRTPERGVRRLGRYLADNNLIGNLGATIMTIERIDDDRAHDDRARLARDRLHEPLRACEHDWRKFAEAVEADPAAIALVERASRRLNRTLEIILQDQTIDLLHLPAQLEEALDAKLR